MNLLTLLYVLTPNPAFVDEVVSRWDDTGLDVTVVSAKCGEENAFYYPGENVVVMCTELYDRPDLAKFILNHELGHAWMFGHDVPNSERGADELALLMSTIDESYAAALWFMGMNEPAIPGDEHQSDLDRAGSFLCVAEGLHDPERASGVCRMYAASIVESWTRIVLMLP